MIVRMSRSLRNRCVGGGPRRPPRRRTRQPDRPDAARAGLPQRARRRLHLAALLRRLQRRRHGDHRIRGPHGRPGTARDRREVRPQTAADARPCGGRCPSRPASTANASTPRWPASSDSRGPRPRTLVAAGSVELDGVPVSTKSTRDGRRASGSRSSWPTRRGRSPTTPAGSRVVHADDDIVVIDKPAGVAAHAVARLDRSDGDVRAPGARPVRSAGSGRPSARASCTASTSARAG